MPIVPDPGVMTGPGLLTTERFTSALDPVHALLQVSNPVHNLWYHTHAPGSGTAIPPAALSGDTVKKTWFLAGVGD